MNIITFLATGPGYTYTYMSQLTRASIVQMRAFYTKSLLELQFTYCQLGPKEHTAVKYGWKYNFSF